MPFFDCHLHTTLKHFLSNRKKSMWEPLPGISILQSQSSLPQVKAGDVKLAISAVFPVEKPMSSAVILQLFGPTITPIDKNRLNDINNSQYFDLIWDELKMLETADRQNEFNILRRMQDYDPSKINLLFSIEGGHSLFGSGSLVENLRILKNHPKYKFVSINLTHLTQQEDICTHAFGMKLLKKNDEFKPNGFGIGKLGDNLIREAYNKTTGPRILVDTKHMSLLARKQFYEHPAAQGHPILASHVGVTGISYNDIHKLIKGACVVDREFVEVKYDRVKGIGDTHFNPWSINLYDEEIRTIVESGGLIGLNLDQRIQGADNPKGEYWSLKEFRHAVDTRKLMRWHRWLIVLWLCVLHWCLMKNPVWHLLARVDVVGGSTGWHRFHLVDKCIERFPEWAPLGTPYTGHWGPGLHDVTNQFVAEGVGGGIVRLALFAWIIWLAFAGISRSMRLPDSGRSYQLVSWALGTALFMHCMNFIAVSYFEQIVVEWNMTLAAIASLTLVPGAAPVHQVAELAPA